VPNPSFEDVNTCAEFGQPCSPSAWFYLSRKFTTGYFPRYPSATGNRHLQIVAASRESVNRQYWETMLLCPLQPGERYAVNLKIASPVNRTDLSKKCPNLRDVGLWFTSRFIFVDGDSILQPRSYLSLTDASTRDLKNGWFEVKKEFVATVNSAILIVGNFERAMNTDLMDMRSPTMPTLDVLIDDLSVVRVKGGPCASSQKLKDWLYSITERHSEKLSGDLVPSRADTLPELGVNDRPRSGRMVDTPTVTHPYAGNDTPGVAIPPGKTDTIIIHNIQFDFDKYLVQNPDTLQQYRRLLTRPGVRKIQVVGFTDDAGSETYNLDLSQKRAREVAGLLSSKFGIDPALIVVEGRGISREYPTRFLNRRVEIYIFH
jgi:outer membrane protein OmpA-like peptidoglycan-associated protein